ncbi:hypothetical protein [Salinicola socius]|uniref:Uncharacterized protein n=1 Tax=Salinicola socius TaxID=404433 RepID=A0A1Q8SWQ1_9GAMM|nr:hypothetical protein [Salinicola socius]OLO05856.1 hypothetical protein BTW07_02655 [Salinicola socius]
MKITDRPIPDDRHRATSVEVTSTRHADRTAARDEAFTRAASKARGRDADRPALAERLDALASPEANDARSYDNQRSIELLQHVIDSVLPSMDADDDTVSTARIIMGEELDWRQAWESRLTDATLAPAGDDLDEERFT